MYDIYLACPGSLERRSAPSHGESHAGHEYSLHYDGQQSSGEMFGVKKNFLITQCLFRKVGHLILRAKKIRLE